ncbi:MAG: patatin-like phospholipase family protein [Pyrinomonadaceae bacterium]
MSKKIGLALSGGGGRGFAHVGVLKALVENNIPIDMIAGTSAGSIVGAAFASGMSIDALINMCGRVRWLNTIRPSFGLRGILSTAPMGKFLKAEFPVHRFEELRTPFAAVAYDIGSEKEIVFTARGDLISAIRASCAVPGIFEPLNNDNSRLLVDGGVVSQIPVETVRKMGADIVIAVDLLACGSTFRSRPRTSIGMAIRSAMSLLRTASSYQGAKADIVIEPQIAHIRPDRISNREECIKLGEEAAREKIKQIQPLLDAD